MPLFHRDELSSDERGKVNLAQLAGVATGTGLGHLATFPLDSLYQKQLLENAKSIELDNQISRENWITLLNLYNGKINLDDLPEEKREFFRRSLQENTADLKYLKSHPFEAKRLIGELDKGRIFQMPTDDRPNNQKLTGNPAELYEIRPGQGKKPLFGLHDYKVRHPVSKSLPAFLGLAGLIGSGIAAEHHLRNQRETTEE